MLLSVQERQKPLLGYHGEAAVLAHKPPQGRAVCVVQ